MSTFLPFQRLMAPQLRPALSRQGVRLKAEVLNIFFILFSEPDLPELQSKLPKQVDDYARLLGELIAKKWVSKWSEKSYDTIGKQNTPNADQSRQSDC